jgi:peptide/nickel transport system substrate-binding protein
MKKIIAIWLCIIITLSLLGCISSIESNRDIITDREIIIAIGSGPYGFQPYLMSYDVDTMTINANIFNSLIEFDINFRIQPSLAESWNNPNDLTWRFNLRDDVKFHNGNNFTANDVKYTIEFIKSDNESVIRELVSGITDIVIIDDFTVDIITEEPCPILLNKLVDVFIVSKDYQENNKGDWPIGTGAYKLIDYETNGYVILERFDDYWKGPPVIKRVFFKIYENSEEKKDAIINGTVDMGNFHPKYFSEIFSIEGLKILSVSPPTVFYIGFDFRERNSSYAYSDINPLSVLNVRKAIYHSINISYLIENNLHDFAGPASQFVSPLIFGYNPEIERASYDIKTAKKLLNESDYDQGFKLDISCYNSSNTVEFCNEIAKMLADINITVNVNPLGIDEYFPSLCSSNCSFYICGWQTSSADGGEIFDFCLKTNDEMKSFSSYNYGYYSNPIVDEFGKKVSCTMDIKDRLKEMQEGFKIAMDDVAWIPLYIPQTLFGCQEDIDWVPGGNIGFNVEDMGFI